MLRILHRIRQNLLSENKFSKYLLYAIGEILLVVIGILIALQINNWNEERKQSIAINNVLIEIKEDLLQDQVELVRNIGMRKGDLAAQRRIINVLENNSPYNETVRSDLGKIQLARNIYSASKGYNLLKELNLGTLKNKELRMLLTKYYERDIPHVYREYSDDKLEFENFWLPYVRKHFKEWEFGAYAVPNDYSQLLDDETLLTAAKINSHNVENTIEAYNKALLTAQTIIPMLPEE